MRFPGHIRYIYIYWSRGMRRINVGGLPRGRTVQYINGQNIVVNKEMDGVWEALSRDFTPREELIKDELWNTYTFCVYAGAPHPLDRELWEQPCVELVRLAELRGIKPEVIRAVCHLIWGRPCYPGKGSLTLCEQGGAEGALSVVGGAGELEVIR